MPAVNVFGHIYEIHSLAQFELAYVTSVYELCGQNVMKTARVLEIGRTRLYRLLKKAGVKR